MIKCNWWFFCDHCNDTAQADRYGYRRGEVPLVPNTPSGWTEMDGREYCPKHKVTVNVEWNEPPNN